MAGHSKWANTKYRKAAQDAKRGKIFTKIIRELSTASRLGGTNATSNPRLRAAIDKALFNNMARDTLNRAIARGVSGSDENNNLETIIYEGYGPGGTAIIIECLSNNRNRTVSDIRYSFARYGGNLGIHGSVAYLFIKHGVISYATCTNKDILIEVALEAGVEDIKFYDDDKIDVYTTLENLNEIKNTLGAAGFKAETTKVIMIPKIKINLDTNAAFKLLCLINMLESFDDIQGVYHNGKILDKTVTQLY